MKKTFVLCLTVGLLLGTSLHTRAQGPPTDPMEVGIWIVNAGAGLNGHGYGEGVILFGFGLKAAIQQGLWQAGPGVISLGGEAGLGLASYKGNNYSGFSIAPRSSYHYGWNVPGLDTYGGLAMGLNFISLSNHSGSNVRFYGGLYVGSSYFFTNSFAVNIELGLGSSMQTILGVAFRF